MDIWGEQALLFNLYIKLRPMNNVLKRLKNISSDCCVTIILNTHRTLPDKAKDRILLKNLVTEAEIRLTNECNNRLVSVISDKLRRLEATIDHTYNLESLVLFASEDIAEYTRLPIAVTDRVIIDRTFATRDLIRTLNKEKEYYVLVLSRQKARLLEALNDKIVQEVGGNFPIENVLVHPRESAEAAIASRQTNLIKEFFNVVDKQLIEVIKENPLPVLICCEESNYHHYLKIADRKEIIIGHLNGSRVEEKAHHIIDVAWPIVQQVRRERSSQRLQELSSAKSSGKLVTGINDIWRAVNEGRGETIFARHDYLQPARVVNDKIELVAEEQTDRTDVIDDIIDEMIEINLQYGGDSLFLSEEELREYQGLALTTRY